MFERLAPEQHDTLDGVPEPSENPRLFGHEQAAAMLAAAYRAGKLPHALLFARPAGIGKATLAFHLAHHLLKFPSNGAAPDALAEPDPASSLFRQIAIGAHPVGAAPDAPGQRQDQGLQDRGHRRRDPPGQPLPVDDLA